MESFFSLQNVLETGTEEQQQEIQMMQQLVAATVAPGGEGFYMMHEFCSKDSLPDEFFIPMLEVCAQVLMSVEGGAKVIIQQDYRGYNIMQLICRNSSVTATHFKAVADIMMRVEGGAEAIFKGMPTETTCMHYLINYNNTSDDIKLEVLIAAASIVKKCNLDDDGLKTFIKQAILQRLPTPLLATPALEMELVLEYGLEDIIKQNTDGLIIADETTGLYPFMMAGLSSSDRHPDLDAMYRMLMACPDVVTMISPTHQSKKRRPVEEEPDSPEPKTPKQK